jgi:hypothetical protein
MNWRWLLLYISCGIALSLVTAASSAPRPRPGAAPADTPPGLVADKGKFRIFLQGSEIGTEDFELAPSGDGWTARGETTIRASGAETRSSGQLRLTADGTPVRYTWTAQAENKSTGTVDFENGTAKTSITIGTKAPLRQDFTFTSPRIAVLDNNLYDQYAVLSRIYDWNAKGSQTFPVLIPQDATPGSITVDSLGAQNIDGASLEVLRMHSTDLEIRLYFDAKRHLVRLEVPDAKVVIVRQ